MPAPAGLIGSPNPRSILARPAGPPNGFGGGLSVFKYCLAHGGVGLGTGPPNRSGGVLDF